MVQILISLFAELIEKIIVQQMLWPSVHCKTNNIFCNFDLGCSPHCFVSVISSPL